MKAHGASKWVSNRIGTIRVVVVLSGWSLKESKDFCEAYMWGGGALEEGSPSTLRSSQIPAGVGERVKRSA